MINVPHSQNSPIPNQQEKMQNQLQPMHALPSRQMKSKRHTSKSTSSHGSLQSLNSPHRSSRSSQGNCNSSRSGVRRMVKTFAEVPTMVAPLVFAPNGSTSKHGNNLHTRMLSSKPRLAQHQQQHHQHHQQHQQRQSAPYSLPHGHAHLNTRSRPKKPLSTVSFSSSSSSFQSIATAASTATPITTSISRSSLPRVRSRTGRLPRFLSLENISKLHNASFVSLGLAGSPSDVSLNNANSIDGGNSSLSNSNINATMPLHSTCSWATLNSATSTLGNSSYGVQPATVPLSPSDASSTTCGRPVATSVTSWSLQVAQRSSASTVKALLTEVQMHCDQMELAIDDVVDIAIGTDQAPAQRQHNDSGNTGAQGNSDGEMDVQSASSIASENMAAPESQILALTQYTHDSYYQVVITKYGGIRTLLRAMQMYPNHETIQASICTALMQFRNKVPILQHGGIQRIFDAMRRHESSIDVQSQALCALVSLLFGSDDEAPPPHQAELDVQCETLLTTAWYTQLQQHLDQTKDMFLTFEGKQCWDKLSAECERRLTA